MMRRRSGQAGFTLIELMVSLIAGLIVALAVVGLSKEATNTFHEESRTATAEMSLRTAVERLRNDLQRAGYMSSANIQQDPLIAHAPGTPNVPNNATFPGLARLSGIHLTQAGSLAKTSILSSLADNQSLTPDSIDLGGNFTSAEGFVVRSLDTGGVCSGQRLTLEMDSPAMWRVRGTPDPNATIAALFQPVAGAQFLVRVADDTGHFQYVPTCGGGTATAQITGSGPAMVAYVDVANNGSFQILSAAQTKTVGGATGLGVGKLVVNPVQIVHWEMRPIDTSIVSDKAYAALASDAGGGGATKYDLFRTYVDASGILTNQTELITEYAIDLKFAFSADLGGPTLNGANIPTPAPRQLTVYGLSDVRNQTLGNDVTIVGATPQRIRSVRFRLSTRAAIADRTAGLIAPAANLQQPDYPLRYCVIPTTGCTTGSEGWARVRTTTTEVALPNQAAVFW